MASKEKHNARWDPCTTNKLLEICVKEIRISGKPGVSFKARRWEVVVDEFNKRANKNYNQKQLKNRLDNLKLDWTTWKQLLGKETGLGWNHETGTIVADDTWWEAKIKDNSKYARFRYQGLEFREELEIIFGETVATSQRSWTPATGAPSEDSSIKTNPTIPEEIDEYDEEETNLDEDASHMEKIIIATIALHNFIRNSGVDDEEFDKCDLNPDYIPEGQEECDIDEEMTIHSPRRIEDNGYMNRVRNQIASTLMENRNRDLYFVQSTKLNPSIKVNQALHFRKGAIHISLRSPSLPRFKV
ncbi:hypothetical protein K1719_038553 [Acacia pycnantha]|nr:hypothetical protein K1719_038553 [Acacia pycnantha]